MRFLWATILKDLRRRRRDPLALALWAGIPLAVAFLMLLAFGGDGSSLRARLLIADDDQSFISGFLVTALGQGRLEEILEVEKVTAVEGPALIADGDASAFLLIPDGFGTAVLNEEPVKLELLTNPAERIKPGIVEGVLETLVDATFYLQRLLGPALRTIPRELPAGMSIMPDSLVTRSSLAINRTMNSIAPYLSPPIIKLETVDLDQEADGGASSMNFGLLFFPSMLFLGLMFIAQGLGQDIWLERRCGTLRRTLTTPQSLATILGGKLCAAGIVLLGLMLIGIIVGRLCFRLPLANPLLALGWAALFGTAMTLFLLTVQVFATSERAGSLLTSLIIFPLAMMGGSFFPFEVMPAWLARIGRLTPNGWAIEQFKAIIGDNVDLGELGMALLKLAVAGGVCFLITLYRLRRGFVQT